MQCPRCGTQNAHDAAFCAGCGAPLKGARPVYDRSPAHPADRRSPVWPWVLTAVLLLAAAALLLILLHKQPSPPPVMTPPIPGASTPAPADTPQSGPAAVLPPVTPSSTPADAPVVIETPPTPSPTVKPVPDAVKVFFYEKELDEFTETVGSSLMLHAQAYPVESFSNSSYQWSVSDPGVVKLEPDSYGNTCTLTILKHQPGGVILTVSCEGVTKEVRVYTKENTAQAGTPVNLTAEIQYRANIFLSNFSEQHMAPFHVANASDDQLLQFVHLYLKINHANLITYEAGEETISLADMNDNLQRFFARSVSPVEGQTYMLDAWNSFRYSGGRFRFTAADGESYNYFTVVDEMTRNADGTYTVRFQVYELGLEEYWNTPGIDGSFYRLDSDGVAAMVWGERVIPVQGGTAVLRDYTKPNGVATYQILDYDIWAITF